MSVMTGLWNVISADSKTHFPSGGHSGSISNPVSHSYSYSNFGKINPITQHEHNTRGSSHNKAKLTTRDTTAASSYTPGSSLPQQPDPSIALLPRGEQHNSLFSKVNKLQYKKRLFLNRIIILSANFCNI